MSEFKETIGKVRSLIERVEGNMGPYEASENEKQRIDEAINEAAERNFIGPNELFDALATMRSNSRVCVGYIMGADLNYPTVKRKNPETNRMKSYPDFETFGNELGIADKIAGVIKLTKYFNFNFMKPDDLKSKYHEFQRGEDDLRARYNMPPINRDGNRGKYVTGQEYGANGIETYSGSDEKKIGRTYNRQNVYGGKSISTFFLIGEDGNIIKSVGKSELIKYIKPFAINGENILRKLGREEEEIKQYIEEYNGLKMKYQTFINDKILYVAAKSDEFDKFTYINTNLSEEIDGVKINPSQFIQIAKSQYKMDQDNLGEN